MEELKVLVFELNNELFATDIMEVERILGNLPKTKLPDSPAFLEGVVKYENEVIPVINLYTKFKFNKAKEKESNRIIVVKKDLGKFGIVVDDVCEVKNVAVDNIDNPQAVATIVSKQYIKGIIRQDNELIVLLDLNNLLIGKEEELVFERVE